MSGLNIHRMSGQDGHKIYHFRCSDVVKPLPDVKNKLRPVLSDLEKRNYWAKTTNQALSIKTYLKKNGELLLAQ